MASFFCVKNFSLNLFSKPAETCSFNLLNKKLFKIFRNVYIQSYGAMDSKTQSVLEFAIEKIKETGKRGPMIGFDLLGEDQSLEQ